MNKFLDSDWITKECSFSVTPVQSCNTSANYKWILKPTRANHIRAVDRKKHNKTKWRPLSQGLNRTKTYLIPAKFCGINENNKYVNQSTSNLTFGQHRRGSTKLLKAYNRVFPYATVHYEG